VIHLCTTEREEVKEDAGYLSPEFVVFIPTIILIVDIIVLSFLQHNHLIAGIIAALLFSWTLRRRV
jgi:hypothetical protein